MVVIVRIGDRNDGHGRHFGAQNAQNVDFFLKTNVDVRRLAPSCDALSIDYPA